MASGSARVSAGCKGVKSSRSQLPIFVLIARFQVVNRRHAGGRNRYKDSLVARVSHRQVVGGERPAESKVRLTVAEFFGETSSTSVV